MVSSFVTFEFDDIYIIESFVAVTNLFTDLESTNIVIMCILGVVALYISSNPLTTPNQLNQIVNIVPTAIQQRLLFSSLFQTGTVAHKH